MLAFRESITKYGKKNLWEILKYIMLYMFEILIFFWKCIAKIALFSKLILLMGLVNVFSSCLMFDLKLMINQ